MSMSKSGEKKLTWQTADPDDVYGVAREQTWLEQYRSAVVAAYVEGYVNGAHHPKNQRIVTMAHELAESFWRTCEEGIAARRASQDR